MNLKQVTGVAILTFIAGIGVSGTMMSLFQDERRESYKEHRMADGSMMKNSMMDQMSMMSSHLEGKTGDAFDEAFLSEMIVHHLGAIEMANQVLATSKRPELIDLAQNIITAQTKEINQMKEWKETISK